MGGINELDHSKRSLPTLRGTPVVSGSNTPQSIVTTNTSREAHVEEWFHDHKLVVFFVVPLVLILITIMIFRCWWKKERKQHPKSNARNRITSFQHQQFHLPLFRRSPIQPRTRGQKEINDLGKLEFSLKYDHQRSELNVNVIRGYDFPLLSLSNVSFTYIVVELRPFSQKYEAKAQTRYVRNNASPVFNDTIKYHIPPSELHGQVLFLSVYDINHLSAHDLMGYIKAKIDSKSITSGAQRFYVEKLKWDEESCRPIGDILVGLRWKSSSETLNVAIQEASSLRIMDHDKLTSSPYVKVQIFVNSFLVLKKRTKVAKRTLNPKFRKNFAVHIPPDCLAHKIQIVLTVKHVGKFRKKQIIGQLYFGHDGKDTVCEQWKAMRENGAYIEMWHQLDESINKSLLQPGSKVNYLFTDDNNSDDDTRADSSDRSDIRSAPEELTRLQRKSL